MDRHGLTLQQWLARLEQGHPGAIELGLDRVSRVRDAMGLAPAFPVILIGGTNGKGSTCAYVECILREQGYRTGLYTSPHLLRYNERVRIEGRPAADELIVSGFEAVEASRGRVSLTYFEHGTLAAMWQFMQANVEVAILEVGLGGRLDATNIFEPVVSAVTSIDLDHQAWLGDTREAIAVEKAGIFRFGRPAICGLTDPPRTLVDAARTVGAKFVLAGRDYRFDARELDWDFQLGETVLTSLPLPALAGRHQLQNAACALASLAMLAQSLPVSLASIHRGLANTALPGRFQRVVVKGRQGSIDVILDVAHNPESARALALNLQACRAPGRIHAVFALLADKDAENVIKPLVPVVDNWYVAGLTGDRGQPGSALAERVKSLTDKPVAVLVDPLAAYAQASSRAVEGDKIVVFGSFYTVAEILQTLP